MASLTRKMQTDGVSHNGRRYVSARGSQIASGTFGSVYKCTVFEDGAILPKYAAVKVVPWGTGVLDERTVLAEREALERIAPHDGIIRLLDSWVDKTRSELYLVMDYLEHGNLLDYSKTHRLDDRTFRSLHAQFLDIIEHIHGQGYVFFDVKPENILLGDVNPPRLVLADFGSARRVDQAWGKILATNFYAAPEIRDPALRHTVGPACDYFAWYMSLFYLLVVQGWPKNMNKQCWALPEPVNHKRVLKVTLINGRAAEAFGGFLTAMHLCDPGSRKEHMTSHPGPWVAERLPVATIPVTIPQPAAWPAPASFQLFAPSIPAPVPVAGPSTSTAAREPSAKRAGAEKCLQKEKVGKGSGVGSTASKRATTACKKAVKTRAAVGVVKAADGPAQAVLKRRAAEGRVSYKKFM